jgi:hypothetical protein
MSDPWEDEGFGAEDDWRAPESLESDLEDDDEELELEGLEDEVEADDELELEADDELDLGL